MFHQEKHETDRRAFLQAGAVATAAALTAAPMSCARTHPPRRQSCPGAS